MCCAFGNVKSTVTKHCHGFTLSTHDHHHTNDVHHHAHDDHTHHGDEEPAKEGHHGHNHAHKDVIKPLLGEPEPEKKKPWNINVQGAYLHVLGDSIQSVGVTIGGEIIWYKPEWQIVDLICTLIFLVIVLGTTINMLRIILEVLMESTPQRSMLLSWKVGCWRWKK
ncbi:hypothetical protein HN51_016933 [Arachis hypogaea]